MASRLLRLHGMAQDDVKGSGRYSPISIRDHEQSLQILVRLQDVARKHGDAAFAAALANCLVNASGAHPECPLGALVLEDYTRTGQTPRLDDRRRRPLRAMNANDPPSYDRRRLLDSIHDALRERAALRNDVRYLAALRSCEDAMRISDSCPIRRLLEA
jgi:hypothetical protein